MQSREEILNDLTESVTPPDTTGEDLLKEIQEISLGSVAKLAFGAALVKKLFGTGGKPAISKHSRPISAVTYAKDLFKARTQQDAVVSVLGLLNISGHVLLKIPDLRDLGHRVIKVVNDKRFEDFFDE